MKTLVRISANVGRNELLHRKDNSEAKQMPKIGKCRQEEKGLHRS